MARIGLKWIKMEGKTANGWKWTEMSEMAGKGLEMAGDGLNGWKQK